ncbi:MAG: hypothetical protein ABIZ04_24315 [Opitutus sp.]
MNRQKIVFRQEKLEGGWLIIHALDGNALVGRILKDPRKGAYRFFPGQDNGLAYQFEHHDLTELKRLIEAALARP